MTDETAGWTRGTDQEWENRARDITARHVSGNIDRTELVYLPACEVVAYYDAKKPWKLTGQTKKQWVETSNPLDTFRSVAHWNILLNKLHSIRSLWPDARREYETRNAPWEPKHESGVLWAVDVIKDKINGHPRDPAEAKVAGPKKVTAEQWKQRCLLARDELKRIADERGEKSEVLDALDAALAQDAKAEPAATKSNEDIERRMAREAAIKQAGGSSPSGDAMQRRLDKYEEAAVRFETVGLEYRPISKDYAPSAVEIARLLRELEAAEKAYEAEAAMDERAEGGTTSGSPEMPMSPDEKSGDPDVEKQRDRWRTNIRYAKIGGKHIWNLKRLTATVPAEDGEGDWHEQFTAFVALLREMYPCVGPRHDHIGFDIMWWCEDFSLVWRDKQVKKMKRASADVALAPLLDD